MRRGFLAMAIVAGCGARTDLGTRALAGDAGLDASSDAPLDAPADAPASCGPAHLAQTAAQPDAIAIDGDWVYWHDAAGISRVKKTGGPANSVAGATPALWPDLVAFALAGGFAFYADGGAVLRAPVGGGTATPLGFTIANAGFATDALRVFVWSRSGAPAEIDRFDVSGANFAKVGQVGEPPSEMVFAGKTAYAAADPGVWKLGFGAGDALLSGLTATDVVVDGATLYFTSDDATNGARVMRLATDTLKAEPIADTAGAFALARDDQDLFVTDALGLRVRRIAGMVGPVVDVVGFAPDYSPVDVVVDASCVYVTLAARSQSAAPGWVYVAPKR